jgi:uncharacterized protein YbcI
MSPHGGAGFLCFEASAKVATKGSVEADIANAVVRFQKEQQGRGSTDVRAHLLGDMVIVRCSEIFTVTESHLSVSEEGRRFIKSVRQELRSINHTEIETIIGRILECEVVRSYYDVDVEAAEQVEIYILSVDVEKRLLRQDVDRLTQVGPRRTN